MDTAVPITATQLAIIWPLLGFLLIWMILFAVLAFRPDPSKHNAIGITSIPGSAQTPSPSAMLHVLVAQPPIGTITPASSAGVVSTTGSDSSNGAGPSTPML